MKDEYTQSKQDCMGAYESRVPLYAVLAVTFLTPVLIVPVLSAPLQFSKTLFVVLAIAVSLAFIVFGALKRGVFASSWSWLHAGLFALPIAYLVAIPFSTEPALSFAGYSLNTDTFAFALLAAVLAYVASQALSDNARIFSLFVALLFATWVVLVFQIVQLAFGIPLPFFADPASNLVGRWTDFGLFLGLAASLILLAVESLPLPRFHYALLVGTFLVSLAFMVFINLTEMWILFGASAFIALTFGLSRRFLSRTRQPDASLPGVLPALGFAVALFFLVAGGGVAESIRGFTGIDTIDVRPTFTSSMSVLNAVYAIDPVFGSGPNTFSAAWLLHRPPQVVQTPFWQVSFNAGSGFIPSSIATGGAVLGITWVLFVLLLLAGVARALFMEARDKQSYVIISLAALGTLYLLLAHVIYAPGQSLSILFFVFVGAFLASVRTTPFVRHIAVPLRSSPRIGFAFILGTIMLMLGVAGAAYGATRMYVSDLYHNRALLYANQGDIENALGALEAAIGLSPQDRYYRTAALVNVARLNQIVASNDTSTAAQTLFQSTLARAVSSANIALEKNRSSFANMMTRGLVFESVVPLGIEGAFDNATAVYQSARALNPYDPEIDVRLARLYAGRNDSESARQFLSDALRKKPDYTDAILSLAQLELDEGNLGEAIRSVQAAVYFEPQNPVLLYQLGILFLQDESFGDAEAAFSDAVRLSPGFSNAIFFLSQAQAFLGRFDEASELMARLASENPDNRELVLYRDSLEDGVNPFERAPTAPADEEGILE